MIKDDEEGVGKRMRNSKETREMKRRTSRESTCRGTAIWHGSLPGRGTAGLTETLCTETRLRRGKCESGLGAVSAR